MPLFFILSGMLFTKRSNIRNYVYQKFITLILPFVFFYILTLLIYWCIEIKFRESTVSPEWYRLIPIVYGADLHGWMAHNIALWFLPALFTTEIIYDYLCVKVNNIGLQGIIVTLISGIGIIFAELSIWNLPWGISQSLVMLIFYYIGVLFRPFLGIIDNRKLLVLTTVIILCIFSFSVRNLERYDTASGQFGNVINFIITAILGSGVIICCSALIRKNYLLELFGKGDVTIVALGLQGVVYRPLKIVCEKMLQISGGGNIVIVIVVALMTYVICWLLSYLYLASIGSWINRLRKTNPKSK